MSQSYMQANANISRKGRSRVVKKLETRIEGEKKKGGEGKE